MTPLQRRPDWILRLIAYLSACRDLPFAYGRHDCALFAAGAVEAMTGHDFAAPFRGRYVALAGGLRVLRRAGFADHVDLAAHHLPAVHPAYARPGDLLVFAGDAGRVLAVMQGQGAYVLTETGQLGWRPLADVLGAFAV
jgi:hypothetical protein